MTVLIGKLWALMTATQLLVLDLKGDGMLDVGGLDAAEEVYEKVEEEDKEEGVEGRGEGVEDFEFKVAVFPCKEDEEESGEEE